MKTLLMVLIGLVSLVAAGCRSSANEEPVSQPEVAESVPEVRYYMIADT